MTTPLEIEKLRYELIEKREKYKPSNNGPDANKDVYDTLYKATDMLWKLSGDVAGYQLNTLNTIDLLKIYNSRGSTPCFHHVKNQDGNWEFKIYYCSIGPSYFNTPDIYEDTIIVDECTTVSTFRDAVVKFHYRDAEMKEGLYIEPSYLTNFIKAYKDTEYILYNNDCGRYAIAFCEHMDKRDDRIYIAIPKEYFFKPSKELFRRA